MNASHIDIVALAHLPNSVLWSVAALAALGFVMRRGVTGASLAVSASVMLVLLLGRFTAAHIGTLVVTSITGLVSALNTE